MRYRLLGNSGLRVSEAALGTMTFGEEWGWGATKEEARKLYDAFREAGGNFFDTANLYTNGTSESFLGEFMQGHRQSVVMATKYTNAAPVPTRTQVATTARICCRPWKRASNG
jgi:aryl-alcohol dehydrogenase-like predicted oxidoreductase